MNRELPTIVRPAGWAPPRGYSDGMIANGRILTIAGQIGWDPVTCEFGTDDFAGQVRRSLENLVAVLRAAGGAPEQLVRLTWFVTSRDDYLGARKEIGAAYREVIGNHYPPMSVVVVSALLEARARVEIEGTAVL